jgi:MYXO-CTERM domain-containing protein
LYSADGITDWQDNGYGWSPRDYEKLFCFEDSDTCSRWYKMERPGVVLENGHPTHITWAVSDVDKDNQIPGNSNHGSKIVVIPFDGVAFDANFGDGSTDASGGADGSGGTGSGGDDGAGGAGTGGSIVTGGATGSGGAPSTGGIAGASTGGSTGGTSSSGGSMSGGSTSDDSAPVDDANGCSCRIADRRSSTGWTPLLGLFGLLGVYAHRQRQRLTRRHSARGGEA